MATFNVTCGRCHADIRIEAEELPRLIKRDAYGRRPDFFCPSGHEVTFDDEWSKKVVTWMWANYPTIAERSWVVGKKRKQEPKPEPKPEPKVEVSGADRGRARGGAQEDLRADR